MKFTDPDRRPEALELTPDNIPAELKSLNSWVPWRYEWRVDKKTGRGEWAKPPERGARNNDPRTWHSFEEAYNTYMWGPESYDGLYLALQSDGSITFTDLDECTTQLGMTQDAQKIVDTLNTYTEFSPSSTGLHCINFGSKPGTESRRPKEHKFEMYDGNSATHNARFMSVTGRLYNGTRSTINDEQEAVDDAYAMLFAEREDKTPSEPRREQREQSGERRPNGDIIQKAIAAKDGDKFKRLFFDGDTSEYGGDDSSADMALCNILRFWCGDEPAQIDGLFRQSQLYRSKWDEPRGSATYGEITIRKVLDDGGDVYTPALPTTEDTTVRPIHSTQYEHPYLLKRGCLAYKHFVEEKVEKDGKQHKVKKERIDELCNFCAHIDKMVTYDDGLQQEKHYELVGMLGDCPLPRVDVKTIDFPSMVWLSQWNGAFLNAGAATKDNTRAAIQFISADAGYSTADVYAHIGWARHNSEWVYLHSAGAIGKTGLISDIDVHLHDARMKQYCFDVLPNGDELVTATKEVLWLLESEGVKDSMIYPEVAWAFRAPLNELHFITTTNYLAGKTGLFKSALQAISQAHFGAGFTAYALPENWLTTPNKIEVVTYRAKDAYLCVDDYVPRGSKKDKEAYHKLAGNIFHGHANKQRRGRLRADTSSQLTYYSRCALASSGEDIPTGESTRGRIIFRLIKPGYVTKEWLTAAQQKAKEGSFAKAMAAYIQWLAGQMSDLKKSDAVRALYNEKRSEYGNALTGSGCHAQTPGGLADFYVGFAYFIKFAVASGAIDDTYANELLGKFDGILKEIGFAQSSYIWAEDPMSQFVTLVRAVLISGRAHVCSVEKNEVPKKPHDASLLGWRRIEEHGDYGESWVPNGRCIGWIGNNNDLYLHPEAAYTEASRLANDQGSSMSLQQRTLFQRMKDDKKIYEHDAKRVDKLKWINGHSVRVVWLKADYVLELMPEGQTQLGENDGKQT